MELRETTKFRGPKVDMRQIWYDEWHLEDKEGNTLFIGTKEEIMKKYDELNDK